LLSALLVGGLAAPIAIKDSFGHVHPLTEISESASDV
jgi:hypothetical protein